MASNDPASENAQISLRPVDQDNWRGVAALKVTASQREFVAEPCCYLALCAYGNDWRPLAICLEERVIGFMMWSEDTADGSCWLGGILVDRAMQGRGYGEQAVRAAITLLKGEHGFRNFALSYQPANLPAKKLYQKLGFIETGEWEGDEIVARLALTE